MGSNLYMARRRLLRFCFIQLVEAAAAAAAAANPASASQLSNEERDPYEEQ